jgi:membrane associated rhomboid family serine protease
VYSTMCRNSHPLLRKDRLLGRGLRAMLAIVALQVVFDSFHPMVSSFLHLAGCACGAVLSLPYSLYVFRRQPRYATR